MFSRRSVIKEVAVKPPARSQTMPAAVGGAHAVRLQAVARGRSARRMVDCLKDAVAQQKLVAMELVRRAALRRP